MIKVFYDGLGCIFTAHDLRLLDDNNSNELRNFLKANTTKQCDVFLLPENVEKRFDVIGNAVVEYLCFDDDSDRKMYLVFDYQSLSKIEIFKTDKSNTFPYNPYQCKSAGENELKLIDDDNSKAETPEYLNENHPMHSPELATAIKAWQKVLESNPPKPKTGSRKSLIENYLNDNHKLNVAQVDRIATLLNPDKTGGAPIT